MECLVYTTGIAPRLTYTMEVLLGKLLGLNFRFTGNSDELRSFQGCALNYGNQRLSAREVFIPSSGFLFENTIRPVDLKVEKMDEIPRFFILDTPGADMDFDLPAMIFYLLSRYEEYLPFNADVHGRYTAGESLAFRNGFLHLPLVNIWAKYLRELFMLKFPGLELQAPEYSFQPTYDVDMAWAFQHKGWRSVGGWAKDALCFKTKMLESHIKVWRGKTVDPFFTFERLKVLHKNNHLNPLWFFLIGDHGPFDKSISWKNPVFQELIQNIGPRETIGIHPSYASNDDDQKMEEEILRLAIIKKSAVENSRQHYLKLSFPATYRSLIQAGIKTDHTMGFAEDIGFRAGIATPFFWYDLEREATTSLLIHPFQVMDVTLKNYLKLSPDQAVDEVSALVQQVKKYGGTFTTLWHNSSFSVIHGWEGWEDVYRRIIKMCL